MANAMEHLNGNQICVIDTETTGLDPFYHEMIQIAILPLDANLDPRQDVIPFYISLKPDHPERIDREAMKVNKIMDLTKNGFDRLKAIDLLEEWVTKLKLPCTKYGTPKRITPLGQNYTFDKTFIQAWMGNKSYEAFFHYHYRDTMIAANYLNDRAAFHAEVVPYSKVGLQWLCHQHKIENVRAHDALSDCVATAAVYKKMCQVGLF